MIPAGFELVTFPSPVPAAATVRLTCVRVKVTVTGRFCDICSSHVGAVNVAHGPPQLSNCQPVAAVAVSVTTVPGLCRETQTWLGPFTVNTQSIAPGVDFTEPAPVPLTVSSKSLVLNLAVTIVPGMPNAGAVMTHDPVPAHV